MTILALEFSSDRRGVAVAREGRVLAEVVHSETRETPIFALITQVLEQAGLDRSGIDCLAVGLGPGSYTGVRLAISVAQGWQLGAGVITVGVSSLENLAIVAADLGPTLLAIDSQRQEFAVVEAAEGRLAGTVRLMSAAELSVRLAAGDGVAGPDRRPGLEGIRPLFPSAAVLAQLAVGRPSVPSEQLTPIYLRETAFAKAPPMRTVDWTPSAGI